MPPELMAVAEYAAHRGVSDSYIRRMRRRGSLVFGDGGLIDVLASDEMLNGLTHPIRGGARPGSGRPAGRRAAALAGAGCGAASDPVDEPSASATGGAIRPSPQLRDRRLPASAAPADADCPPLPASISVQEAVRRERLARARLAELELGEQAGKLMRVDTANRVVVTLVRQALNQLQGMTARLAKTLAAETDAHRVGVLLDAEVANICQEMRSAATALLTAGDTANPAGYVDADADADDDPDDSEAAE